MADNQSRDLNNDFWLVIYFNPISEYRVKYWETNDKKDVLSPKFLKRVQDLEVRLDRLKPFTSYRVEICACNEEVISWLISQLVD